MHRIDYEIKLSDLGRPYVSLSDDYEDKPEDKFLVLELAIYFLNAVFLKRRSQFDDSTNKLLSDSINMLGQISDEMAHIVFNNLTSLGEMKMALNDKYDLITDTIKERDDLPDYIMKDNVIFRKIEGLRVLVNETNTIYTLVNGINNENWKS